MREAPSLDLLPILINAGHTVKAFDPEAMENAKKLLPGEVQFMKNPMETVTGSDALVVLTEWDVFRGTDLKDVKKSMKGSLIKIQEPLGSRSLMESGKAP